MRWEVWLMGWQTLSSCAPVEEALGGAPSIDGARLLPSEVVRVPLRSILYLQAMAENGRGDQPKPRGHALPFGHVCYRQ